MLLLIPHLILGENSVNSDDSTSIEESANDNFELIIDVIGHKEKKVGATTLTKEDIDNTIKANYHALENIYKK